MRLSSLPRQDVTGPVPENWLHPMKKESEFLRLFISDKSFCFASLGFLLSC